MGQQSFYPLFTGKENIPEGLSEQTHTPHQSTGTAALECLRGFDPAGNASTWTLKAKTSATRQPPKLPCDWGDMNALKF